MIEFSDCEAVFEGIRKDRLSESARTLRQAFAMFCIVDYLQSGKVCQADQLRLLTLEAVCDHVRSVQDLELLREWASTPPRECLTETMDALEPLARKALDGLLVSILQEEHDACEEWLNDDEAKSVAMGDTRKERFEVLRTSWKRRAGLGLRVVDTLAALEILRTYGFYANWCHGCAGIASYTYDIWKLLEPGMVTASAWAKASWVISTFCAQVEQWRPREEDPDDPDYGACPMSLSTKQLPELCASFASISVGLMNDDVLSFPPADILSAIPQDMLAEALQPSIELVLSKLQLLQLMEPRLRSWHGWRNKQLAEPLERATLPCAKRLAQLMMADLERGFIISPAVYKVILARQLV
eukprot:TRINITY_DN17574_c0_g1_i5.p1 TRINITY_DN17574_c0_g1~~TRINITY_DN17574_c0_g1_i5.p1  ORF type:complete len:356 (-),score=43.32 TRINITY_DN17574_c0_g1_i5:4-1071(-)